MTIKIPEPMIAAALKTLQESGAADSPLSCDALLVERMIVAALMGGSYDQIGQLVADIAQVTGASPALMAKRPVD